MSIQYSTSTEDCVLQFAYFFSQLLFYSNDFVFLVLHIRFSACIMFAGDPVSTMIFYVLSSFSVPLQRSSSNACALLLFAKFLIFLTFFIFLIVVYKLMELWSCPVVSASFCRASYLHFRFFRLSASRFRCFKSHYSLYRLSFYIYRIVC